jgi:putative DNA primase/helicase
MNVTNTDKSALRPKLQDIRTAALALIGKGLVPLPLPDGQKKPLLDNWPNAVVTLDKVNDLFTDGCNIGLRLDTLTDLDLDCPEAIALAPFYIKETSARWGRATARNSHHLYKVDNSKSEKFADPTTDETLLEIRHDNGHQSMIPPSIHPEGELLHWEFGVLEPAAWDFRELHRAASRIAAITLLSRHLKPGSRQFTWLYLAGAMKRAEWQLDDALKFLNFVTNLKHDEHINNRIQAIRRSFETDEQTAGLKKLEEYLDKSVVRKLAQWLDLRRTKCDPLDLTDDANAQSLHAEHNDDLRYLPNEGKGGLWVFWNDVIWQRDRMSFVTHLAAESLKKKSDQLTTGSRDARLIEKVKRELLNMPGVNGALGRLSCYPDIAVASSAFDVNPWLLGAQNGIFNLQLNRLEEGMREHLVSRQVTAAYDPQATCPRWKGCLERAQPDAAVRAFLQRLAGACLFGMQTEHGFIFNWGKGANFKTAYSEVLRRVMGDDYAATPNEELFFKGNQEVPKNYVADIHGMRLLTTNEKNEGSEWNLEFIKRILGGQQLNACRKYCEAFSFVPTARIIAAANTKPRLNELDEATRRRFLLVPWNVTIPEKVEGMESLGATQTNPAVILKHLECGPRMPFEQLMALLLEERNGILRWMLEGAHDFVDHGLRLDPPPSIRAETEKYFADEDILGRFIKDCGIVVPVPGDLAEEKIPTFLKNNGSSSALLHVGFAFWSNLGKYTWSLRKFSQRLDKANGVVTGRGFGNKTFANIRLTEAFRDELAAEKERRAREAREEPIPF